jgi:sugar lactone lactonase YvrE
MQTLSIPSGPSEIGKGCIRFLAATALLAMSFVGTDSPVFAGCISILSPAANSNVTGIVALPTNDSCAGVHFEALVIDGVSKGAGATGTLTFDTTKLSNGPHTFTINSQSANPSTTVLGSASIVLNVLQPCNFSILSPSPNSTVGGLVFLPTDDACTGVHFEALLIDGVPKGTAITGRVTYDTSKLSNGPHTFTINSQSANPGTMTLGTGSIVLNVSQPCISIVSPLANSSISGVVAFPTNDVCSGAHFEALQIDSAPRGAAATGKITFDTSTLSSGPHIFTVNSQSANPGSTILGSASVVVNVSSSIAGSALWYGSDFDSIHGVFGDDVGEITPDQLKNGTPSRIKIVEKPALNNAMGVAFDGGGNLWVTTMDNHVFEFSRAQLSTLSTTPSPVPVAAFTSSAFEFILGCTFDAQGNLWVVDSQANGVDEFAKEQLDAGGQIIAPAVTITSNSLGSPAFGAFDSSGNLWVSSTDNSVVARFNTNQITSGGSVTPDIIISGPSLNFPGQLQFDKKGNLWVTNSGTSNVVEFSKDQLAASGSPNAAIVLNPAPVGSAMSIDVPWGLAFDPPGNLWVYNYTTATVAEFSSQQLNASGYPVPPIVMTGFPFYAGQMTFGPVSK